MVGRAAGYRHHAGRGLGGDPSVKRARRFRPTTLSATSAAFFNSAIGTPEFGTRISPIEQLSPKDLTGKREARERTLTNDELRAVWAAADGMGYPYGPMRAVRLVLPAYKDDAEALVFLDQGHTHNNNPPNEPASRAK